MPQPAEGLAVDQNGEGCAPIPDAGNSQEIVARMFIRH
jgi:hypothetical protein